jgi:hypothetical protein
MDKLVLGVMVCVVASACTASPPEAGDGKSETIRSAAELLVRAQDCAGELKRVERRSGSSPSRRSSSVGPTPSSAGFGG